MPPQTPANWYPDPTKRHEYRYYDGLLTMLALLQVSGNFRVHAPPAAP